MQNKKIIITSVFGLFFINSAFANQSDTHQLTQLLGNLKTYQADFDQVIQDKRGQTIQESTGRMALKRPGLFRWDTLKPNQQLIIADGKTCKKSPKNLRRAKAMNNLPVYY
jgi:chaperone LolA